MVSDKREALLDWLYFDDRPVGYDDDLLWRDNEEAGLEQQIREVAQRIVAPLRDDLSPLACQSLVFAVHGSWGSGKSSVLSMIQHEARRQAGPLAECLHFCEYLATIHEHIQHEVKPTLVMRILLALADYDYQRALGRYQEYIRATGSQLDKESATALGANPPVAGELQTMATQHVQKLARDLAELVDVNHLLRDVIVPPNEDRHVAVVMIDDLDRCNPDFVSRVLDCVLQLSSVPNLFFLLAVDREQLKRAVEQQYRDIVPEGNPYYAMEKYVQHTLTIPEMNEKQVEEFIGRLLAPFPNDGFSQQISREARYLARGLRNRTPRTIKRCLNTIRPVIQRKLRERRLREQSVEGANEIAKAARESEVEEENLQRTIKEQVLAYSWPDFYHRYFSPGLRGERPYDAVLSSLEEACMDFGLHDDRDEDLLSFQVGRIANRLRTPEFKDMVDASLAKFLALPPYWLSSPPSTEGGAAQRTGFQNRLARVTSVDEAREGRVPEDPLTRFQRLYIHCEDAYSRRDRNSTLRFAREIYELVSQFKNQFGLHEAPRIGNVAVDAEIMEERELAMLLYELAIELDPSYSNNLQNYVDFIVKSQLHPLYGRADELLHRLETEATHRSHLPHRTLLLRIQLAKLRGDVPESGVKEKLDQMVNAFLRDPSDRRSFISMMSLTAQLGELDRMLEVGRAFYQQASSEADRYLALRGMADQLAASDEVRDEARAMDIYRYLLDRGLGEERAQTMNNYATLLNRHGYSEEAGRLWYRAYAMAPTFRNIQRAYSNYLLAAGRPELAVEVMEERPIAEQVLQPGKGDPPERFSDEDPLGLFGPPEGAGPSP